MRNLFLFIMLFFSSTLLAAFPKNSSKYVNDFTNTLNSNEIRVLESKLKAYTDTTKNTICVVITNDLEGKSGIEYAQELGHEWGVGQKNEDNGVVFLIKPKTKDSKGTVAIATGYGVEGDLPDAICSKIVRQDVLPKVKNGDYYGAINSGIDSITEQLESRGKVTVKDNKVLIIILLIIAIIILIYIVSKIGIFIFSTGSSDGDSGGGGFFDGFGGGDFGGGGFDIDF